MSEKLGGTTMHCPLCDQVAVCAALPYDRGNQLSIARLGGVWHFSRNRQCQHCEGLFETVEIALSDYENLEMQAKTIEADLTQRYESAFGADETILNWEMDLNLRIRALERNVEELRGLSRTIKGAVEKNKFLKTSKG